VRNNIINHSLYINANRCYGHKFYKKCNLKSVASSLLYRNKKILTFTYLQQEYYLRKLFAGLHDTLYSTRA